MMKNSLKIREFFHGIRKISSQNLFKVVYCIYAEVAQLVEQLSRNQQVVGSSPIFGTI